MILPLAEIQSMADKYRQVRIRVFNDATRPINLSTTEHERNKDIFRSGILDLCDGADLSVYQGTDNAAAHRIWHHLWTKIRYAGIKAAIASREIRDIEHIFDDYTIFVDPEWDISVGWNKTERAHYLKSGGAKVHEFLDRTGVFANRQTIGNLPKLEKTIFVAHKLHLFTLRKPADTPVLNFITNGMDVNDVWSIHRYLVDEIGYTSDLTALHLMMDLGFEVIKPDIVITSLFLIWGWLHQVIPNLPRDLSVDDLHGKGIYKSKYLYTKASMYKPVIDLARQVVKQVNPNDLQTDIGWTTRNQLREFDIFTVKYGQEPEPDFGIVRCLSSHSFGRQPTHH